MLNAKREKQRQDRKLDSNDDSLSAAEHSALSAGEDPPDEDLFGLLELECLEDPDEPGSGAVPTPDRGQLFSISLPAESEEDSRRPIEDEYSMAEIEQRAAVYLRRRFALLCNDTQAEKNRQAAAQSSAAAEWRHGDVAVTHALDIEACRVPAGARALGRAAGNDPGSLGRSAATWAPWIQ